MTGESAISQPPILVSRLGDERVIGINDQFFIWPQFDPSGENLALVEFSVAEGGFDVWLYNFNSQTLGRRTFDGESSRQIWSKDGERLIYRCGTNSLCTTAANGTDTPSTLVEGLRLPTPYAQLDNTKLIVGIGAPEQIHIMDSSADAETLLTNLELSPSENKEARLSQDQKWLAYSSDETGRKEIYVRPFPDVETGKWQVSRQGGSFPIWNQASNEIIWWSPETDQIMTAHFNVAQENENAISFSNPTALFNAPYRTSTNFFPFDYNSANEEFVFISPDSSNSGSSVLALQTRLKVIENFSQELRNAAPAFRLQ